MHTRSKSNRQESKSKSNNKKRSKRNSDDTDSDSDTYDPEDEISESECTVSSSECSSTFNESSESEYEPKKSKTKATKKSKSKPKSKSNNKRQSKSKKMSIDDEEQEDDHINHIYEQNEGEKLPEAIVYLKAISDPVIKPDPRLFDVINNEIDQNIDQKDPENEDESDDDYNHDINGYLENNDDTKIKNKYFQDIEYGMLNENKIESLYLQREAMNIVMDKIDKNIERMIENADRNIFNEIVEFVSFTYSKSNHQINKLSIEYLWSLGQSVIPTAMLMCGQNVSDHPLHFEHLQNQLSFNVTPLIVRFTQDDLKKTGSFGSKMYDAQRFIVEQLFQRLNSWKVSKLDETEISQRKQNKPKRELRKCREANKLTIDTTDDHLYFDMKKQLKLPSMTAVKNEVLRTFILWYFKYGHLVNKYHKKNDNIKSSQHNDLPKIIIMIDCIEQWSPMLLSSLIYTLHGMSDNYGQFKKGQHIPFVLVLGVSTTEDLLSRMVEPDALRLLSVSRHYFEPSYKLYKQLAEEILIESSPILFDSCILNKLLNHYQLNDYSVSRFKDQIRYLFMSYFMNTNASQYAAYLLHLKKHYKTKVIREGPYDGGDHKRDETSFNKWWFEGEYDYIKSLIENIDEYNEGDVAECFKEYLDDQVFAVYQRYRESLRVFKMITDHLKFNWSRTEIIAKLQNKELLWKYLLTRVGAKDSRIKIDSEERKNFPTKIGEFDDCHAIYGILHAKTKLFDPEFSAKAAKEYQGITNKLKDKSNDNNKQNRDQKPQKQKKLKGKKGRSQLRRQLTGQTNMSLYEESRTNLFLLLKGFIEKHLKPMNELPLHQVFVYKNEKDFCLDMFPPTSNMIRKRYENCYQLWGDTSEIEPEPMGCIYDVYQQSSLYINLHDAYIAFKEAFAGHHEDEDQIKEEKKKKKKKTKKRKSKSKKKNHSKEEMSTDEDEDEDENGERFVSEKEKLNHIQFRMSVDDLKFCGFVKATNRKREVGALMKMAELL